MTEDYGEHIGFGRVVRVSLKAICVRIEDLERYVWIPRSVVSEQSEIESDAVHGDEGNLMVDAWFAEKEELA